MSLPALFVAGLICGYSVGLAQPTAPAYSVRTVAGIYQAPFRTPAQQAVLNSPRRVITDRRGGYYIAGSNLIYNLDSGGRVSVVAGSEDIEASFQNGIPATRAFLGDVWDIALNRSGELHFADAFACVIRKVDGDGMVRTVAGNGRCAPFHQEDVPATSMSLNTPQGITFDNDDRLLISETFNNKIRRVGTNGAIATLAGNGTFDFGAESMPATAGGVVLPQFLSVDKDNNVYFVEYGYCRVRKIDSGANPLNPTVVTVFENLQRGCFQGGTNPQAMSPIGLTFVDNTLYVAEEGFNRVSVMVNKSSFRVVAGDAGGVAGFSGDGGPASASRLNSPVGLSADGSSLLIADTGNHRIRSISRDGNIRTLAGSSRFGGDNGPASSASLFSPRDMAFNRAGDLYFADEYNHIIRRIDRAGVLSTVAGIHGVRGRVDGPVSTARFSQPRGVAVDSKGNIYVSDWGTDRIRRIDAAGSVVTITSSEVKWKDPGAIVVSPDDLKLYVADAGNNIIRVIDLNAGEVKTLAGNGTAGFAGDRGPATLAQLNRPEGLALDRQGNLLIADTLNRRLRRVDLSTGNIDTIAGNGELDAEPSGPARQVGLARPTGVSVDSLGNIYIALDIRSVARLDATNGTISTIAGRDKTLGFSGDGGLANSAAFNGPWAVRASSAGDIYVADSGNNRIRLLEVVTPSEVRVAGGNNQSAPVNMAAAAQIRTQVMSRLGIGIPGIPVTFSVTSGGARLSASRVFSDREGLASVTVTMGPAPGNVQIRATAEGLAQPAVFTLNAVSVPVISTGGISGAAGSATPLTTFTAGSLFRIRGENLADGSAAGADNLVAGALPTVLRGVCVTFGSVRAPLVSISPQEIVAQVPRVEGQSLELKIVVECGTAREYSSAGSLIKLASAAPEFFSDSSSADGRNVVRLMGEDGRPLAAGAPGAVVTLIASGLGDTDPPVEPGSLPVAPAPIVQPFTLRVGDLDIPADQILFAGLGTSGAGLYEVRFRIPESAPPGESIVVITVGGAASPPAYLRVNAAP